DAVSSVAGYPAYRRSTACCRECAGFSSTRALERRSTRARGGARVDPAPPARDHAAADGHTVARGSACGVSSAVRSRFGGLEEPGGYVAHDVPRADAREG